MVSLLGMGLLCLGTFCSFLSPRTTQYHCGQHFPSNHRIHDYIIPCTAAELVT